MIVACVDHLFPIFKSMNNYDQLMENNLSGNYEHTDLFELHEEAWEAVKGQYEINFEKEKEQIGNLRTNNRVQDSAERIVFNALDGNVEKLYLENRKVLWGKLDNEKGEVTTLNDREEGAVDLLNLAAIETVERGGNVHLIDRQYLKAFNTDNHALAVLRY